LTYPPYQLRSCQHYRVLTMLYHSVTQSSLFGHCLSSKF